MIENKQKEIDGTLYEFRPMFASDARKQLVTLIKKFGPSVASAIEGIKGIAGENFDEEATLKMLPIVSGSIGGALRDFCNSLTPEYYEELVNKFFKQVSFKDGENMPALSKDRRELMFATNLLTETKVLIWCLEVQYADFFESAGKVRVQIMSLLQTMNQSRSESPKDSTGQSSE